MGMFSVARTGASVAALLFVAACGAGPAQDVWAISDSDECRTISAGWGAPVEATKPLTGERFSPIRVDRVGGAPSFLFLYDCKGGTLNGEPLGAFTFAAYYIYSEPEIELVEPFALKRGKGQVMGFAAGDPDNPLLKAFARHGAPVYPATVTWTDEIVDDKQNVVGVIDFEGGGAARLEAQLWAQEDGDSFNGHYDAAGGSDGRIARFHGEEYLERREPRFVSVTLEGETPLAALEPPATSTSYLRGFGQAIVSTVTLQSDKAPKS